MHYTLNIRFLKMHQNYRNFVTQKMMHFQLHHFYKLI
nr:MAG TPA: hypothetical protein [Caudoviricetes sp.]